MQTALDDYKHARIKLLCEEGDNLCETKNYRSALEKYGSALEMLPEPVTAWNAATWIFAAMGDACFLSGDINRAYDAFSNATHCPEGIGNPFIHLRLGQIHLALGNEVIALDELTRAYMGGGKEIFKDEDPRCFELVRHHLKEPPSGW